MVADPHAHAGTAAIGATLVIAGGADRAGVPPAVDTLASDLRREVIDVAVGGLDAVMNAPHPEPRMVMVVWFPAEVDTDTCERLVAWADTRLPRLGLIAWAPIGDAMCAEIALASGFDDAVAGSVSTRELGARIRAVHRRVQWQGSVRHGRLRYGALVLDVDGHELWLDGRSVALTTTEMQVIRALMRAGGRALTRTDLLDHAWGSANFDISERAVDNVILRLRRKLPRPELIQTVRGVGFRLSADD